MTPYAFPDGTGTIDLPAGWTCDGQSAASPTIVKGPDDQQVTINLFVSVSTPDGMLMRMYRQNVAQARQMGLRPMPSPMDSGLLVAPYGPPGEAVQPLIPQLNRLSQKNGKPTTADYHVTATQPVTPGIAGGRAALMTVEWTKVMPDGTTVRHRSLERQETDKIGDGADSWMIGIAGIDAPADRFDRDAPVLWQVFNSYKPNAEKVAAVWAGRHQDQARASAATLASIVRTGEERRRAANDRFDAFQDSIHRRELAGHRSSSDFAELMGGYQKVVNTKTGEERSVDYCNSTAIVAGLNESAGDNSEWVQVHLRDEQYPMSR